MPAPDAYLFFEGTCAEAMRFYAQTLGGKLDMMTHAQSPMGAQANAANAARIMHARLNLDGRSLMASDTMAAHPHDGMKGFALALTYPTAAEAKRIFDALADGGQVTMPMQKTFWAEAFGMLTDRFGTPWMVNGNLSPGTGAVDAPK